MGCKLLAPVLALVLGFSGPAEAQTQPDDGAAGRIQADMAVLAADGMEGREAGTSGYDRAAAYVASQMAQLGLKPGGADGGFLQTVPLTAFRPSREGRLVLRRGGSAQTLAFGADYLPGRDPLALQLRRSAALVFAGHGVSAPARGQDDYQALDVRGKIVVVLPGAPARFHTEERAYYGSLRTKRTLAEARGAVGLVLLTTPAEEARRPFAASLRNWRSWSMTWRDDAGRAFMPAGRVPQLATLSRSGAEKLFAGAARPLAQVYAAAEQGAVQGFPLPGRLEVDLDTEVQALSSANVVGIIEGADPALRGEAVVLTAHLDHIGTTSPVNGDAINNGALDNASGVAVNLEVARGFMRGPPPRRTVVVAMLTAEEKGLLGSEYFVRNPPAGLQLVANVNLDMPILTYGFTDVVAFGAERSSLGAAVGRAAARMGVAVSPDPLPEEGLFTRSDHYRFVEAGAPAVFLMTGFRDGGEARFRSFLRERYHQPGDDLSQPIDYEAGARFARLNYLLAREVADADESPSWRPGDFFGELFGR